MRNDRAEDLFRRQAIQSLNRTIPGRPICAAPQSWRWLSGLVIVLFSFLAVFVATADFARKENVRGWLVSRSGVVRISSTASAVVNSIEVRAGQTVKAGDALVYLSTDSTQANGIATSSAALQSLRAEVSEIDAQLELSTRQTEVDLASLQRQLRDFDSEIAALTAERLEHRRRVALGSDKARRLRGAADKGAVSRWDLMRQQDELSGLAMLSTQLEQEMAIRHREQETLRGRLRRLPIDAEFKQSALRERRSALERQISQHETRRLAVLTAPIDGIVASVEAYAGNAIRPGELLMTLLPETLALGAEAFVPSRAVGMVAPGQSVRIAYDAFPRQVFGTFRGRIERVSDYVLMPADTPSAVPMQEASYKIHIAIDRTEIATTAGSLPLRPGMLLGAELVLEQRSLLDWLLEPLRSNAGAPS